MAKETSNCSRLVVAAIDFGTTYSGYAFSFRNSPLDVKTNQSWVAGSEKLISLKTPTCVLLNQKRQFHSFGYEAENKYSSLAEDDEHHGWLLFRRFKMLLHTTESLGRHTQIDDISGKSFRALDIFVMSIRYLKDHLLDTLNKQAVGIVLEDIQFVLTIPAIWDDKAKQFMREAAIEAGIPTDQLKLALEPEAASVWCQVISSEEKMPGIAKNGNKYMVIDLGGGTADITVHEQLQDGTLREIHKASGGSWGGIEVDKNYIQMLEGIVGVDPMRKFKAQQMGDYFDVLREFETKKRTITKDKEGKITFKMSASLKELFEEKGKPIKSRILEMKFGNDLVWMGDKIRLEANIAKDWFKSPIDNLIQHVTALLQQGNMEDVNTILLVGGFGESPMVQDEIRSKIKNKTLIIPDAAGLVVLKGAVRFGHLPEVISSRKAKMSYGIEVWGDFNEDNHLNSKLHVLSTGEIKCKDLYKEMVKIDEDISVGRIYKNVCDPLTAQATTGLVAVYSSEVPSPIYTTDDGCKKLGQISIEFPDGNTIEEKKLTIEFCFGDTELLVKVRLNKTGKTYSTTVDCF